MPLARFRKVRPSQPLNKMFDRISYLSVQSKDGEWSHFGYTDMGEATAAAEKAGDDVSNLEVRLCVYAKVTRNWKPAESAQSAKANNATATANIAAVANRKVDAAKANLALAKENLKKAQADHDAVSTDK